MLCEVLLSSLWFLFVIFWVETITVWVFLSIVYHDLSFYQGNGVFAENPVQILYFLSSFDTDMETQT